MTFCEISILLIVGMINLFKENMGLGETQLLNMSLDENQVLKT